MSLDEVDRDRQCVEAMNLVGRCHRTVAQTKRDLALEVDAERDDPADEGRAEPSRCPTRLEGMSE